MFTLQDIFEVRHEHPMCDVKEARKLLAKLPRDDIFKKLEEITLWLNSVKDSSDFRPEVHADVIMLLDDNGHPLQAELLHQYLMAPHLQDFQGMRQWQVIHNFMQALAEAYAVCIAEFQLTSKNPWYLKDNLTIVCVRMMRAVAERMKLKMMRYLDVDDAAWGQLYNTYHFAVAHQFDDNMVHAYPNQIILTSPRRELLRALMLQVSSPHSMAPEHIESCYRITGRMVSIFDFKSEPDADCAHFIDLSEPCAPKDVHDLHQITPTMRFFGAVRAAPRLQGIVDQYVESLFLHEQRLDSDFTPAGKLTVLNHLLKYWGHDSPHRHQERREIHTSIEVSSRFTTICQRVAHMDLNRVVNSAEHETTEERAKLTLAPVEDIDYTTETWSVLDVSPHGIGGIIPQGAGEWVKIGALCALKSQNNPLWWVGMIRRLQTDSRDTVHVGVEILAKKPLSVWLRALGKDTEKASNWETSSGSFAYTYLPVILLPDSDNSYVNATMLMESGRFTPNNIYDMMMGEKSRNIQLTSLLAEGDDYEQVSFKWMDH